MEAELQAVAYSVLSFGLGIFSFGVSLVLLPKMLNRLTPGLDEEKEIAGGNRAAGTYFGLVVGSAIIGVSIIIAAAIIAGMHG